MMVLHLIFLQAYEMRNAGAVIHSHGIEACLVTMIRPLSKEFRVSSELLPAANQFESRLFLLCIYLYAIDS